MNSFVKFNLHVDFKFVVVGILKLSVVDGCETSLCFLLIILDEYLTKNFMLILLSVNPKVKENACDNMHHTYISY